MMCEGSQSVGCEPALRQDCLQSKWLILNQDTIAIYRANRMIDATGVIEVAHATPNITQITMVFWMYSLEIVRYEIPVHQSLGFTVNGFNFISLEANGGGHNRASGTYSLLPRYK